MSTHRSYSLLALAFIAALCVKGDAVVNRCTLASDPAGGAGSVDLAKALSVGGRITFSCPAGSVIAVASSFTVALNTEIDGGGSITLDDHSPIVMFVLGAASPTLTLTALTLHGGGPGAVVSGKGTLVVNDCSLMSTPSPIHLDAGQAIFTATTFSNVSGPVITAPSITLTNVNIQTSSGAVLVASGGRVRIDHSVFSGGSGSLFDACTMQVMGSVFSASTSSAVTTGCDTSISTSNFTNNQGVNGGALFVKKTASRLSLSGSTFSGNNASAQGGAIAFEPSTVTPRSLQLSNVRFESNRAADGGAIHLGAFIENNNVLIGNSLIFSGNSAINSGGAIAGTNAQLSLTRSLFVGNSATKSGGAIQNSVFGLRPTTIVNSLFTNNSAPTGSAIVGAAIQLVNVTVANNRSGAAISPFWPSGNPNSLQPAWFITLHNVALSKNEVASCENNIWKGLLQDGGQNLQFPASGCPATIPVADPLFDSLFSPAWNGAATGKGDLIACLSAPVSGTDLFGRHRPSGQSCAIGAVEGDLQSAVQQNDPTWGNPPWPPCSCGPGTRPPAPPPPTVTPVSQLPGPSGTTAPGNPPQPPSTGPPPPSTTTVPPSPTRGTIRKPKPG